jgi:hypothetical protein
VIDFLDINAMLLRVFDGDRQLQRTRTASVSVGGYCTVFPTWPPGPHNALLSPVGPHRLVAAADDGHALCILQSYQPQHRP